MIKQLLFSGMLLLILGSCKKNYTCECTTTLKYPSSLTGQNMTVVLHGSTVKYSEKLSRTQAEAACIHEETAIQTNVINWDTRNGAYVYKTGESTITECSLD